MQQILIVNKYKLEFFKFCWSKGYYHQLTLPSGLTVRKTDVMGLWDSLAVHLGRKAVTYGTA